jgi:hypothetical protein
MMKKYGLYVFMCAMAVVAVVYLSMGSDMSRRLSHATGVEHDTQGQKTDCNGKTWASLKEKYLADGYVVFRSCSLNKDVVDQASFYTGNLTVGRITDAFRTENSVMALATDPDTLEILGYLNSRAAFPFQTLNFPVATQQPTHSDVIHFDTLPQRGLMTAAWVALEDIHPDSGPLRFYPGSHKMGLWDLDELGIRMHTLSTDIGDAGRNLYEVKLQEAIDHNKMVPEHAIMSKGETFIWAASLLHGGSKLNNPKMTRKSQVTHYYLVGAKKYWVPWRSIPSIDKIKYKCNIPACTPTKWGVKDCATRHVEQFKERKFVDFQADTAQCQ